MVLAVVLVPLVLTALRRAHCAAIARRIRQIVQFTWPVWAYVSVTGVLVYLMLYQLAPVLHPTFVS